MIAALARLADRCAYSLAMTRGIGLRSWLRALVRS